MTRFVDIDLARLPRPDAIQVLDYEARLGERMAELVLRLQAAGIAYDVGGLESDPLKKVEEHAAYYELLLLQRINEAVRAVLLPTSLGADLDNLASDLGVKRMTITPATDAADAVMEDDTSLRRRRQLAVEALTVAGPEGAYLFHALSTTRLVAGADVSVVKDAAVYGPTSTRETAPGVAVAIGVAPGHVHVPIINRTGSGAASAEDIAAVAAKLNAREVRPIADFVTVSAATITNYAVVAVLRVGPGADPELVRQQALARMTAYTARQHRVGAAVLRSALFATAHVAGTDGLPVVDQVVLSQPAADVDPGAYGAPYCTGITVTIEVVDG